MGVNVHFLGVIRHPPDNITTMAVRAEHNHSFIDQVHSNFLFKKATDFHTRSASIN
jgi:hypothetical protein